MRALARSGRGWTCVRWIPAILLATAALGACAPAGGDAASDAGPGAADSDAADPGGGPILGFEVIIHYGDAAAPADAPADAAGGDGPLVPLLHATPAALDFGAVGTCSERRRDLELSSAGTAPVRVTGIALDPAAQAAGFRLRGELLPTPAAPDVLAPGSSLWLGVSFSSCAVSEVDPDSGEPLPFQGALTVESDALPPAPVVPLQALVLDGCVAPTAVAEVVEGPEVAVGTALHLRGDRSTAVYGEVRRWEWRVDQPTGSQSIFVPSPTFPNPTFEVYVPGVYTFYLDVWDQDAARSCDSARYEVTVLAD